MTRVTTVIPVFNGEKYIIHTLESLARQTLRPDRVIVLDDQSTDRTEEIVRNFNGLSCDWIPNEKNLGLFPNHNRALTFAAETEFLHILHADDAILPTFFERLVPLIEKAAPFALAFGGHAFVREDGSETTVKSTVNSPGPRRLSLKEFLISQTELRSIQLHSCVLKTGGRPLPVQFRTDAPQVGDVIFHSELAELCSEIWAHPEVLCQVRTHPGAATNKNIRNINAWVLDEWRAMQVSYGVMQKHQLGSWTREQKLKLLFAARSHVKIKMVKKRDRQYANEIRAAARRETGAVKWAAAWAVVELRDRLFPKPDIASERLGPGKST